MEKITKTKKSTSGTSYHNVSIKSTYNKLVSLLGSPDFQHFKHCGWNREIEGKVFTLYNWKVFKYENDEEIEWMIGSFNPIDSYTAYSSLRALSL